MIIRHDHFLERGYIPPTNDGVAMLARSVLKEFSTLLHSEIKVKTTRFPAPVPGGHWYYQRSRIYNNASPRGWEWKSYQYMDYGFIFDNCLFWNMDTHIHLSLICFDMFNRWWILKSQLKLEPGMGTFTWKCNRLIIDYIVEFCIIDY